MLYDYIIIGSGIGGLSAGLNLTKAKKKVLMLEKNSLPGGLVATFKKGRFEFDTSIYNLYDYGDIKNKGTLQVLLNEYDIELDTKVVDFNMIIKDLKRNIDIEVKGDIDNFRIELEKLKNDSTPSINKFLDIIKEIHKALEVVKKRDYDKLNNYPNFNKYIDKYTLEALSDIGMQQDTIDRLSYAWVLLGSPINKLSFIDFSDFMYKLIYKKQVVLLEKNLDFIFKLVNAFQKMGGKIFYNSHVVNVREEKNVYYVKTADNLEYKAKHIISNTSARYFFKEVMDIDNREIKKLENARSLSFNGIVVYLGLNASYQDIGLNNYEYFIYDDIRSTVNINNMMRENHNTIEAIVPNVVNEEASPTNTTILILKKVFAKDVFNDINKYNYQEYKEKMARDLIDSFEDIMDIDIKDYIEEIEIVTPKTIRKYTNNINGAFYGYKRYGFDNMIHRLVSSQDEIIPGISFVGGNGIFGANVDNAFYDGYYVTNKLLGKEDLDGE